MKSYNFILGLSFFALLSCQPNNPQTEEKISGKDLLAESSDRSMAINFNSVEAVETFDASTIDRNKVESIVIQGKESLSQNDREEVVNLMRDFMAAENQAAQLEVTLLMSDEPVENGVFVFSIETPKKQALSLQMYDEEGFEMAANNKLDLKAGKNYKALNVKSLEEGAYLFLLKDDSGKELMRKIVIEHQ